MAESDRLKPTNTLRVLKSLSDTKPAKLQQWWRDPYTASDSSRDLGGEWRDVPVVYGD